MLRPIWALLLLTIAVAHASVIVTRTSNDGPHPSTMEIAVALPDSNNNILIPLTRTDAFEDIPITLLDNGVSRTFSSRQAHHPSHSHYRHVDSKSVISVRQVSGKRQISGHVMHEGTSYFLEPVGESEHRVVKNHEVGAKQSDAGKIRMQSRRKRQTKTSPTTNTVELYLLLDSTVWTAFQKIYGTDSATLTELHFYYTHILNGIDTAYRNLGTPSVSVSCIGITISKAATDDAWMPSGSVDASTILSKLAAYIPGKTADHFMAFTRNDITDHGNPSVCGMAYLSGVCKSIKVSINEDQGLQSWGTAAHELGHNLGSEHDGSGNTCSADLLNLMAPSSGFYTLENIGNSYRFSDCSKKSIAAYITSLGSTSCLLSAQGNRLPQLASSQRQGARMTLDKVCLLSYPNSPGKFYITDEAISKSASICASIYCHTAEGGGTSTGGLRAPVGTPCGNQKSCDWNGQCSADASAPAADETCFWGDTLDDCAEWKTYIVNKWETCTSDIKKKCCKSLAGVAACAGI